MIIYLPSDLITVKAGDVTLKVAPLSYEQKTNLLSMMQMKEGKEVRNSARTSFETLRSSIKEVVNLPDLTRSDGSKYDMKWENGALTEESLEVLLQVLGSVKAPQLSTALILSKYSDPGEGIVFEPEKKTN